LFDTVELALFEREIFEIAPLIQSPAKCEVCSVIRLFKAKGEHPVEIHTQIAAVYVNIMNQQNGTKWRREFSKGKTDVHDKQRSGRPSLISYDLGNCRRNLRKSMHDDKRVVSHHSQTV